MNWQLVAALCVTVYVLATPASTGKRHDISGICDEMNPLTSTVVAMWVQL